MKEQIHQEKKLGRGLSALLGESKIKPSGNYSQNSIEQIELSKIIAGIYQPRKNFNQAELEELADSIRENGVIQPIILRKIRDQDQYEIIAGERRFRASQILGATEIPAIVKKINNHEALEIALIENIQREDLSLMEEANGYKQLGDDFSYTQEQIAKKVGKSRSHITNLLRLLTLPESVQTFLDQKLISMGHARAIINSDDPEALAQKIINDQLNVRDAEDLAREEKVAKSRNTPVLLRSETKIKFINSEYLVDLEKRLSGLVEMEAKIHYNSLKNSGKITIKFDDLDKIQALISQLEQK
jgi:ParB family chromosome partitioning protein